MRLHPNAATRRFALIAAATGMLGAIALPGRPVGLGLLLVSLGLVGSAATLHAFPGRGPHAALLALALLLSCAAVLRDARWLVAIDLVAAAGLASLAASRGRAPAAGVRGVLGLVEHLPAAPAFAFWSTGLRLRSPGRVVIPPARGLILAAALSLIFGGLFASADAAFAQITGDVLTPDVDLGLLPARLGIFAAVVGLAAGLVTVALAGAPRAGAQRDADAGRRAEWVTAVAVLDLLFAAFVVVQLTVLFGGHDHVLATTGLTYAQYAREGFVQLAVAALLTLGVIAAAWPHPRRLPGRPDTLEVLLGLLCVLTLVVLASALRRLGLYEDAFGFTVARLSAQAMILWIGAVLVLVMAATLRRRTGWLALAIAGLTGASLLSFTLVNPEGLVAERNVERFREQGRIDGEYLSHLSADATPALAGLRGRRARCAVTRQAVRLDHEDGFFALNRARERARRAIAGLDGRPSRASC